MAAYEIDDTQSFDDNLASFGEYLESLDKTLADVLIAQLSAQAGADPSAFRESVYKALQTSLAEEGKG